jgi:hypothetical protein
MILLPQEFEALTSISAGPISSDDFDDQSALRVLIGNHLVRLLDGQAVLTARGRFAVTRGVLKRFAEREVIAVPDSAVG